MKASELKEHLEGLIAAEGDQEVLIDTGMCLCVVEEIDLGSSDEGIIIWAGDLAE